MNAIDSGFGWKKNWAESRQNYIDWWNRKGLVVTSWSAWVQAPVPHAEKPSWDNPGLFKNEDHDWRQPSKYDDVESRAKKDYARLRKADYGLDIIPLAGTDIGPGSLALALGCEPGFSPETVWFEPCWKDAGDVDDLPPVRFNPDAYWWQVHEAQMREHVKLARGNYLAGLPDLVENIDIIAAMRDPQTLMTDMIDNPEWVEKCVREINVAWFDAFGRLYDIAKGPDGGNGWCAFSLWGPGKTAKLQCDACSMFSPEMFDRFVTPSLTEQCEWLDYSMYHLDGTQCMCHLDNLLAIDALDAIEWTPQAGIEDGWHERWHPMYKKILDAGKSLQVVGVPNDKVEYVLKAIGSKGVYLMTGFGSLGEIENTARIVDKWR